MAVALLTIEDIEEALGHDLTAEESAKATYYINAVSAKIAAYCDLLSLEVVEDDIVRAQADFYGIIELGGGPISEVTTVASVDGDEVFGWTFDGTSRILGLEPFQTVDITLTHGSDEIPEEVHYEALEAVVGTLGLSISGPLKVRTVGDVSYQYSEAGSAVAILNQSVLDKYKTTDHTFRVGDPYTTFSGYRPINWFQVEG